MAMASDSRGITLHEVLSMKRYDETDAKIITVLPPVNSCELTDEELCEEDEYLVSLPASQMSSLVEFDSEEESPEEETETKDEPKRKKFYEYIKEDLSHNIIEFPKIVDTTFTGKESPVDLFFHVFDEELLQVMVDETNRHARQKNIAETVDVSVIKRFIGIFIHSGYVRVASRDIFWDELFGNELISQVMPQSVFEHVLSHLHFADNEALNSQDKFAKVRPLFKHLNRKFIALGNVEENHSISEVLIPYNGQQTSEQYMRKKFFHCGYKFFVGATKSGYINWFEPYPGEGTIISDKYKALDTGPSLVLEYADKLKEKWPNLRFHLFFGKFFSSPSLLLELEKRNLYGTGTIEEKCIPGNTLHDTKAMKTEPRGTYDYQKIKDSNVIFVKWRNSGVTTFCSNKYGVEPLSSIQHNSHNKKVQNRQPYIVKAYRENVRGVASSERDISRYRISICGDKWYFPLIAYCIDMTVHNTWLLHKSSGGRMDQLKFRRSLVRSLLPENTNVYGSQRDE